MGVHNTTFGEQELGKAVNKDPLLIIIEVLKLPLVDQSLQMLISFCIRCAVLQLRFFILGVFHSEL